MTFLAVAYGAVCLLIGGYVIFIGLRQRKLRQEIETLEEIVNDKAA